MDDGRKEASKQAWDSLTCCPIRHCFCFCEDRTHTLPKYSGQWDHLLRFFSSPFLGGISQISRRTPGQILRTPQACGSVKIRVYNCAHILELQGIWFIVKTSSANGKVLLSYRNTPWCCCGLSLSEAWISHGSIPVSTAGIEAVQQWITY